MRRSVYIPDDLDKAIEAYLAEHEEESFSSIIQEAIQRKLAKRDVESFLALAGMVKGSQPLEFDERPEDKVVIE